MMFSYATERAARTILKKIPTTKNSLALRTDFSDESAWAAICSAMQKPVGEFRAYVHFVSDSEYEGVSIEQLPSILSEDSHRSFAFIIDHMALSHPEHPILVVDLHDKPGRTFRVIPSESWAVENNLSIANMGFEDFADAVDRDGIFRGFPLSQEKVGIVVVPLPVDSPPVTTEQVRQIESGGS